MYLKSLFAISLLSLPACLNSFAEESKPFHAWATTPPMGWNSWGAFGCSVTEDLTKANADFMAGKLVKHGYEYVIVDVDWYEGSASGWNFAKRPKLSMDEFGRLLPDPTKFPSSAGGNGFKPLADYVHGKGLKFGLHLMRGIPREALLRNATVYGTEYKAAQIADIYSTSSWNSEMFGVELSKPGAQEYYDSVFYLLATWGIDFVQVDDLSSPYYKEEIAAIRAAIDRCGRPIVLSIAPGATPLEEASHAKENANLWRITTEFSDNWKQLKEIVDACEAWAPHIGAGRWADPDALPLGAIKVGTRLDKGSTRLTKDEQRLLFSLCCIARTPLLLGAHLPMTDEATLNLITNEDLLELHRIGINNRVVSNRDGLVTWVADTPEKKFKYIVFLNTKDAAADMEVEFRSIGLDIGAKVKDLWSKEEEGAVAGRLLRKVSPHSANVYRLEALR